MGSRVQRRVRAVRRAGGQGRGGRRQRSGWRSRRSGRSAWSPCSTRRFPASARATASSSGPAARPNVRSATRRSTRPRATRVSTSSREERSEIRTLPGTDGEVRAFVEVLEPPLRLVICGAGHDAAPLVRQAAMLGWSPVVVDDRARVPEPRSLPRGERLRPSSSGPRRSPEGAAVDERTHVVVMSHNFLRDKGYVRALAGSPARFVAAARPARAHRAALPRAPRGRGRARGTTSSTGSAPRRASTWARRDPQEIAAAICAEIVAVKRRRGAGFLRDRPGPIHERRAPARTG